MKNIKGILLSAFIALIAYLLSDFIPGVNSVLLALILGMLLGNSVELGENFKPGIGYSSKNILEFSIVLLAFGVNLNDLMNLGAASLLMVLAIIVFTLSLTFFLNRFFKCPGNSGLLVGFGSAICGSGAIAALAPSISSKSEDVGIALPVINVIGGISMILLPLILEYVGTDVFTSAVFIGGSLPSVGNVAGAGFAISHEVGDLAITIKMMRVALLVPAVLIFGYFVTRNKDEGRSKKVSFPVYLIAFSVIALVMFFIELPTMVIDTADLASEAGITISMAAIGIKTKVKSLVTAGKKAITFGLIIYLMMLLFITLILQLI